MTTVTVRYWAAARAAAGVDSEQVEAATLADLLMEIRARHHDRDRFDEVIAACSALVDEVPVGRREPGEVLLSPGQSIEFLPPFAGG
jgi:molybdopterin converting factor small subunit